jgi:hypothetical protein
MPSSVASSRAVTGSVISSAGGCCTFWRASWCKVHARLPQGWRPPSHRAWISQLHLALPTVIMKCKASGLQRMACTNTLAFVPPQLMGQGQVFGRC